MLPGIETPPGDGGDIRPAPEPPGSETQIPIDFSQHNVVVVIPAYNEGRCIGSVILRALQHPVRVVVVDDGSCDDTAAIAEAAGATVVRLEHNCGKGVALRAGFQAASHLDPDVIVTMDGDSQHLVEELHQVVRPVLRQRADIVIGSRYLQPDGHTPRGRVLGHRFFNLLTRTVSGARATDSQSGYRAFSRRAAGCMAFHARGFAVESEMQFIAAELGLRLAEVPVTIQYPDRPKRPAVAHGLVVLNGLLRLVGQYRPLLFFGLPGALVMLGGMSMGFVVVEIYRRSQQLAVGYAMVSVLLTIIGMVGFSTGIILHSVRALLTEYLQRGER